MLKIKLARFGKRNQPHYRIVVNEARDKRDGSYVESIGHYAPTTTPKLLEIDLDAYKRWLEKGAQPTDTVARLVKRFESGTPFPEKPKKPNKKAQARAAAETEAAAAAAEKPAEPETPAEAEAETPTEPESADEPKPEKAAE